jgi:DNA-directed RNA polymerase alpha subunit
VVDQVPDLRLQGEGDRKPSGDAVGAANLLSMQEPDLREPMEGFATTAASEDCAVTNKDLHELGSLLVKVGELIQRVALDNPSETATASPVEVALDDLNLNGRSRNRIEAAGIQTINQLTMKSKEDLLSLEGFGDTCLANVRYALGKFGLALAGEKPYLLSKEIRERRQMASADRDS